MTIQTSEAASPLRSRSAQVVGRVGYRASIEAFYEQNPTATQEQARRATGAPRVAIRKTFDAMVRAGRLRTDRWKSQRCADE